MCRAATTAQQHPCCVRLCSCGSLPRSAAPAQDESRMHSELRSAVQNHPAHGEPATLGHQQLLPFAFIFQECRDERNPKIQSRIQSNCLFFPHVCMHKSAQGTPDGFQVCRKLDLVLPEPEQAVKARELGFREQTQGGAQAVPCALEDQDRIRLLPTLRGCPGSPQATTSTLDGVLHCTSHLGSGTLCPAAPGGNGAGQGAPAGAVLPSCLHPHGRG